MTELHHRLARILPERNPPGRGAFVTEPRALRAWVQALPMANFGATAKLLLDALREVNRTRVDPAERLDALETLRAPAAQLAHLADQQIVGASFPLPPQKAELGAFAQQLQHELALGYAAALHDFCAPTGAAPFLKTRGVAAAAVRALQHGGERLHKAYLLYRTPPTDVWQFLHDVFRFAASLRLDDRAVEDSLLGANVNARLAYVHALLLALSNPYRYAQRELVDVIALTRTLAPYGLLREGRGDAALHTFAIDRDSGPGYLPEEREHAPGAALVLDLRGLLETIEAQLALLPTGAPMLTFRLRGGPPVQVGVDLIRRLVRGWTSGGERGLHRLGGTHLLESVIGLHDLHFVLAGNEDFDSFMRRVRGMAISLSEHDRIASWAATANEQVRATRLRGRVLDQSLGGYRLIWERAPGGEVVRAKVGELVGLSLPTERGEPPDWMVGVIRWIRIDDEGRVDAGVELLARRALPVGVRAVDDSGNPRTAMRGIALASLTRGANDGYASLLAPGLLERAPREVEITLPADPHRWPSQARVERVAGLDLVESTGAYLQFALPVPAAHAALGAATATEPEG